MSLLTKIERFLQRSAMSPTRFGRLAVNDPRLIGDLRHGRRPRIATLARIEAFLGQEPA